MILAGVFRLCSCIADNFQGKSGQRTAPSMPRVSLLPAARVTGSLKTVSAKVARYPARSANGGRSY